MTQNSAYTPSEMAPASRPNAFLILAGMTLLVWAAAVALAATTGLLGRIPPLGVAATVAAGIIAPTLVYALMGGARRGVAWIGLRGLTAFHVWRIPAALAFFWYGVQGALPPIFVGLAGVGDLLAGLLALWVVSLKAPTRGQYAFVHLFGMADFIVAVGTGVTLTLLRDPQMDAIRHLPLALIPYFGVALSGATHLIAFDLLRRNQIRRN